MESIVENSGMGALSYRPVVKMEKLEERSLDEIALECEKILNTQTYDDLDYLFSKGASSGGARPKILTNVDGEDWIICFRQIDVKGILEQKDLIV